jgi:hypothetical protein
MSETFGCTLNNGTIFEQEPKFYGHPVGLVGGTKDDSGKLRMDLITPEMEEALASILTYGASKYEDRNWEQGIKYSRIYAAMRRHLLAWLKGEVFDNESGLPHINHAFCCLAFLVTYEARAGYEDLDDLEFYDGVNDERSKTT